MLRSHAYPAVDRRRSWCILVAGPLLAFVAATTILQECDAQADTRSPEQIERQTRTYSISIDGTRRGSSTTQFRGKSGTVRLRSESEIKINYWVFKYNYTSSGTETCRNGRIVAVDNKADYNGTEYSVKGTPTPRGFQITTNDVAALVSPDIWDTSYLILPDRLVGITAGTVVLFDSDKGRCHIGKIRYVGEEVLNVGEGQTPCVHYRIAGEAHVDLWYDASRRLVLEESQESGHKVRFELLSIAAE